MTVDHQKGYLLNLAAQIEGQCNHANTAPEKVKDGVLAALRANLGIFLDECRKQQHPKADAIAQTRDALPAENADMTAETIQGIIDTVRSVY